jgi:hypothetical protein
MISLLLPLLQRLRPEHVASLLEQHLRLICLGEQLPALEAPTYEVLQQLHGQY